MPQIVAYKTLLSLVKLPPWANKKEQIRGKKSLKICSQSPFELQTTMMSIKALLIFILFHAIKAQDECEIPQLIEDLDLERVIKV